MRKCAQCGSTSGVRKVCIGYIFQPSFPKETADVSYYSADLCSGCRKALRLALIDFVQTWKEKKEVQNE